MAEGLRGSQFVHLEHYSLKASTHPRSKKGRANVKFVVEEMLRVPSASRHVPHVKPPTLLMGTEASIKVLPTLLRAGAATLKDPKGRKQRVDTPVLMGVIFSHPSKVCDHAYLAWEEDTITFVSNHFGSRAVAIVRHEDEEFPHLHVLVHDQGRSVHGISPGYLHNKRSRASLVEFQNHYQSEVGAPHKLSRWGPRREREPLTKEHKRVKAGVEAIQIELSALRSERSRLRLQFDADSTRDEALRKQLAKTRQALELWTAALQRAMSDRVRLQARQLELEALEVSVTQRAQAMTEIEIERFAAKLIAKKPIGPTS